MKRQTKLLGRKRLLAAMASVNFEDADAIQWIRGMRLVLDKLHVEYHCLLSQLRCTNKSMILSFGEMRTRPSMPGVLPYWSKPFQRNRFIRRLPMTIKTVEDKLAWWEAMEEYEELVGQLTKCMQENAIRRTE